MLINNNNNNNILCIDNEVNMATLKLNLLSPMLIYNLFKEYLWFSVVISAGLRW